MDEAAAGANTDSHSPAGSTATPSVANETPAGCAVAALWAMLQQGVIDKTSETRGEGRGLLRSLHRFKQKHHEYSSTKDRRRKTPKNKHRKKQTGRAPKLLAGSHLRRHPCFLCVCFWFCFCFSRARAKATKKNESNPRGETNLYSKTTPHDTGYSPCAFEPGDPPAWRTCRS